MDREQAKAELRSQTARISWQELERYFAAGKVILVDKSLDLIAVGAALIDDDTVLFTDWTQKNLITPVDDQKAKKFASTNPTLWASVVAPWVLIQERRDETSSAD